MNDFFVFLGHHWILAVLLIIVIFAIFVVESMSQGLSSNSVEPTMAVQLMNQKSAMIIDTREKSIFSQGHIIGAQNVFLTDIESNIKKWHKQKDKPIIVVSEDVGEMTKTRDLLIKNEFTDVKALKGGISAWKAAGLPLEKTEEDKKHDH